MISELLYISILHASVLYLFFLYFKSKKNFTYTSPEVIYIAFSVLHVVSQAYFSFNITFFEDYIRANLSSALAYVYAASFLKLFVDVLYLVTSSLCNNRLLAKPILSPLVALNVDLQKVSIKLIKRVALCLLILGSYFTYKVIVYVGGIGYLWLNLGARSTLFEGGGLYLTVSRNAIQFAGLLYFSVYATSGRIFVGFLFVLFAVIMLSLTGSRSSFIFLIFSVVLYYYTFVKPFKFNVKAIVIVFSLLVLFSMLGKLRGVDSSEKINTIEYISATMQEMPKHIAPYVSQIRRDVVILKYFEREPFWYGFQYYSLLTSVIPRNYFMAKPVLDGGRYVVGMYKGFKVAPIMQLEQLPETGWPEGNMAGYINFGVFGLFLFTTLSALLVKGLYLYSLKGSLVSFFLFSYSIFITPISFDPYGIFKFTTYVVTMYIVGFIVLMFRSTLNVNKSRRL